MNYLEFLAKADEFQKKQLLNMIYDLINMYDIERNDMSDQRHVDLVERIRKATDYKKYSNVYKEEARMR